jgi:hypothetical protein
LSQPLKTRLEKLVLDIPLLSMAMGSCTKTKDGAVWCMMLMDLPDGCF